VVSTRSVPRGYKGGQNWSKDHLWDIRQPVRTLAEDVVRIRFKETTSEEIEGFMCGAVNSDVYSV
jgi:hypothetical protein